MLVDTKLSYYWRKATEVLEKEAAKARRLYVQSFNMNRKKYIFYRTINTHRIKFTVYKILSSPGRKDIFQILR